MAPRGVHFSIVSFTDLMMPPSSGQSADNRSRINRYSLDLCGIATTGYTLSWRGWSFLILSHSTTRACPFATLSLTLVSKCAMALGSRADLCGLRLMAACISPGVQSQPVRVGHPNISQSKSSSAALCFRASPWGAISVSTDVLSRWSQWSCGSIVAPLCISYCNRIGWHSRVSVQWSLFCFRSLFVVAPVAILPIALIMRGRNSTCSACSPKKFALVVGPGGCFLLLLLLLISCYPIV